MNAKGRASDIDIKIGQNLKFLRLMHNYSQAELASELDISFQQLQKYEKGKNRVSVSRLLQISEILNVNMLEFLEGVIDKPDMELDANSPLESLVKPSLSMNTRLSNNHLKLIGKIQKLNDAKKVKLISDFVEVIARWAE